jgi:hypothetical protein
MLYKRQENNTIKVKEMQRNENQKVLLSLNNYIHRYRNHYINYQCKKIRKIIFIENA